MTTNKRASGRADPSDEPIITRLRSTTLQQQDAVNAPVAAPTHVSEKHAAEDVATEDKTSSNNQKKTKIDAQRNATDATDEKQLVDYEPTDNKDQNDEEETDASQ
jgi:hypothetical protein